MIDQRDAFALPRGTRLGDYEIADRIGFGGMGEVYRARDVRLGRDVAVKVLPAALAGDPDRLARFEREARMLAALNHPNIAHIYGVVESDGRRALVMELVDGPTLADHLKKGALPIPSALAIAAQIADALSAAHEQRIIHRDLKPSNVIVRDDGVVKVLDFGLAKALESGDGTDGLTRSADVTEADTLIGTAGYMSPERAAGKPADVRSDLWAFGVVLLEMLTGRRAFEGESAVEVLAAVLKTEPDLRQLPARTPEAIRRLLRRCLQKDPKRRFDSAATARMEIEDAIHPVSPSSAVTKRSLWPAAALALGAIAVLSAMWIVQRKRPGDTQAPPTRMQVALSEDNSLTPLGGVAISPDGQTIAFGALSADGQNLYVRRLSEWQAHRVPGAVNIRHPSFSPDSSWIAFSSGSTLYKVPAAGGAVQLVCPQAGYGAEWTEDGGLVYGSWRSVGIWRVDQNGGAPRQIVRRADDAVKDFYFSPVPVSGSRAFLFTLVRGGQTAVAVQSPEDKAPRVLIESGRDPRLLPGGVLAFVASGRIVGVRFDPSTLTTSGTPVVLAEDVDDSSSAGGFDVASNGTLVYEPPGALLRTLAWKDRRGGVTPLALPPREYQFPALSPDGSRIALTVQDRFSANLWTAAVDAAALTRLTTGENESGSLWSPDGKRIFYSAGPVGSFNVFSIDAGGTGAPTQITSGFPSKAPTSWTPGAQSFLYNSVKNAEDMEIWEYPLAGQPPRPIIRIPGFRAYRGHVSPDGHALGYLSNQSGRDELYVQRFPDGGARQQVSTDGVYTFAWSHSGRELFFSSATTIYAVPVLDPAALRLGAPERLFVQESPSAFDVGPDDQRFLVFGHAPGSTKSSHVNVVLNWMTDVRSKIK